MATYEIHYSLPRARRGMNAWGVFERESPEFSFCVVACFTEAEAKAALAKLQNPKGWDVAETSVEG